MNPHWAMIWHQAMSRSFLNGKAFGWNKTVVFPISAPASGTQLRLRFSNRFGEGAYEIGAVRAFAGGQSCPVTLCGKERFQIPPGGVTVSDPCELSVQRGETVELRLYYTNAILDSNMIEEAAALLPGDQTLQTGNAPLRRPLLAKLLGAYNAIPAIEAVEVLTEEAARAITAFGDSITAMSRWTKPLAARLAEAYPGEYALRQILNDWIRSAGIFDYVFDAEAVVREERPDGIYYAEGLHQGDHLHPNARGGQKLADAYDLEKLTGKEA